MLLMKKREDNFQNNHNAKQNQVRKFQLDAIAGKGSRPEAGRAFVQRGHGKKKKKQYGSALRGIQNTKMSHSP